MEVEKVATLYEAHRSLKAKNVLFTDRDVVHEVLHHWHESKQRISEIDWHACLQMMKAKGWLS